MAHQPAHVQARTEALEPRRGPRRGAPRAARQVALVPPLPAACARAARRLLQPRRALPADDGAGHQLTATSAADSHLPPTDGWVNGHLQVVGFQM